MRARGVTGQALAMETRDMVVHSSREALEGRELKKATIITLGEVVVDLRLADAQTKTSVALREQVVKEENHSTKVMDELTVISL